MEETKEKEKKLTKNIESGDDDDGGLPPIRNAVTQILCDNVSYLLKIPAVVQQRD